MKISFETKFNVDDTVFYIKNEKEYEEHQCASCEQKANHTKDNPTIIESKVVHILPSGGKKLSYGDLCLERSFRIQYYLKNDWYMPEEYLFKTREEAEANLNNPEKRVQLK